MSTITSLEREDLPAKREGLGYDITLHLRGAHGVMVIVVGNRHCKMSSNPGQG